MTDLASVVQGQISCRACVLRDRTPIPLYVPLHLEGRIPLVMLDRPYSDVTTPRQDPRRTDLIRLVPELQEFAWTYRVSCWSDPASLSPDLALRACRRHRTAEVDALNPPLVVAIGEAPSQWVTHAGLEEARGMRWMHRPDVPAVVISEQPTEQDVVLLRELLAEVLPAHELR